MRGVTLHLHIRRLVIEPGSPGQDFAREGALTAALRAALLAQIRDGFPSSPTAAGPGERVQSLPQRIAAGILSHDAMRPVRDEPAGGHAPSGATT